MRIRVACTVVFCFIVHLFAADIAVEDVNADVNLPAFDARISIGFNYDLLRDPTKVSFEEAKGYCGFNIPISHSVNLRDFLNYMDPALDSFFLDSSIFSNGEDFKPTGSAKQNANITIQVDVPMLGGVASFSNTQNFLMNYSNALGNPDIYVNPDSLADGAEFLMRGTVNVPLNLAMRWETMTFGYAYRINRHLTMALNLHRHVFSLDLRGKIDVDILGRLHYKSEDGSVEIDQLLNYPSEKVYGKAYGHYEAEAWTPTIGLKVWRLSLVSRFGLTTEAKGEFNAGYSLPFFIDPETFKTTVDFDDPDLFTNTEIIQKMYANATDSISYSTKRSDGSESTLSWHMPTGLTLSFDIVPEHLSISYTKIFGDIDFKLDRIAKEYFEDVSNTSASGKNDSLIIDAGVTVDNIIMIQVNVLNAFLNLGVFGLDFRYADKTNLIGSKMPYMHMGKSAMIPVINFGSAIGTKLQLLLELDVLPLPALKTGIFYHF